MKEKNNLNNDNINDSNFDEDELFDEELFEGSFNNSEEEEEKENRKGFRNHYIFFAIVLLLLIYAIVRLVIWNKGTDSGYDPNEDTSEFDTEPLDYIQPLNSEQLAQRPDDGITTIFCMGNSTFADNGEANALAREIGSAYEAEIINASFADSLKAQFNPNFDSSEPRDGISLKSVTEALLSGDFTTVDQAAAAISEEAVQKADYLKTVDLSKADMLVIMYDLMDYVEHRPVLDPGNTSNPITVAGALESSIRLIQEKYPYIRIVVLSTPASGKTIDDFYVDGDIQNLGNGTLVDYLGHEANICISNGVSFIDTYFGVINVDNRDEYLVDDYHLNDAGAKAIAERMKELIILNQ